MLILKFLLQVYIVSGGWGSSRLASTEILEKDGGRAWQRVANLPKARTTVRGLGLDGGRFMITGECWTILYNLHPRCSAGGHDGNYLTDVLIYDSGEDEWTTVGQMSTARGYGHGMGLVPKETADYCV